MEVAVIRGASAVRYAARDMTLATRIAGHGAIESAPAD
jgi:hypothetical protein